MQAKIEEPELYELHERVQQIRKGQRHPDSTESSTWQHISQDGIAAQ